MHAQFLLASSACAKNACSRSCHAECGRPGGKTTFLATDDRLLGQLPFHVRRKLPGRLTAHEGITDELLDLASIAVPLGASLSSVVHLRNELAAASLVKNEAAYYSKRPLPHRGPMDKFVQPSAEVMWKCACSKRASSITAAAYCGVCAWHVCRSAQLVGQPLAAVATRTMWQAHQRHRAGPLHPRRAAGRCACTPSAHVHGWAFRNAARA